MSGSVNLIEGYRLSTFGLDEHVLPLDLIGAALRGPHRDLALGDGQVLRYPPDIANFATLGTDTPDAAAWETLSALPGDAVSVLSEKRIAQPPNWARAGEFPVVAMTGVDAEAGEPEIEIVELGAADVPEMLDLVARTAPGPFLRRTIELGGYIGIRRGSVLAAMAGRRMHPPGWIEISAVCTDPEYRGQGLARELIKAVVWRIRADGSEPMLHAMPNNSAVGLYERLGFKIAREQLITRLQRIG
jgi:ribosomal protein S18 acetylase RimI-like enzyme